MARRKKYQRNQRGFWRWVLFAVFTFIIALLATSLWTKRSPSEVISTWYQSVKTPEKLEDLSKTDLIDRVTSQQQTIDSLERHIAKMERTFGIALARVKVDSDALNLRKAPGLRGEILARIPSDSFVPVLFCQEEVSEINGEPGKWCKVRYGELQGWVWGNYLEPKM